MPDELDIAVLPPTPVTVLRCAPGRGHRAAKHWQRKPDGTPKVIPAKLGTLFNVLPQTVQTIHDFHALLEEVRQRPDCFIIRGVLREDLDQSEKAEHRRLKDKVFQDARGGLRWVLIDIDKVRQPAAIDPIDDPDGAIEHLIGLLPPEFQDAACSWEFSASSGSGSDTLSAHLWFMLDRPMTDTELSAWAEDVNAEAARIKLADKLVDTSLFRTVQPHLLAAPTFEKGLRDPLPKHSAFREGVDKVVSLPAVEPRPRHVGVSRSAAQGLDFGKGETPSTRGFEGHLARIGDGEGLGGFHGPITSAIASHVTSHGAEGTDAEALKAIVRARVAAAPRDNHAADYIANEVSDRKLDESIKGAIEKFGTKRAEREAAHEAATGAALAAHRQRNPVPLKEAEEKLRVEVDDFFREALAWNGEGAPPQLAIRAEAGLGKTQQVLRWLASPEMRGRNAVVAVPTLGLADELAGRLRPIRTADSPPVFVHRGRSAKLPDGRPMCAKSEIAEAVARSGQSVTTTLCERTGRRNGEKDEFCPHHPERGGDCPYMLQRADKTPGVRIVSHPYLFIDTDGNPVRDAAILITDESFWGAAIDAGGGRTWVNLDRLDAGRPYFANWVTDGERNDLHTLARQVKRAFEGNDRAASLREAGVTPERCRWAAEVERRFVERLGITPDMAEAEQRKLANQALKSEALRRVRFWKLLADVLESGANLSLAFHLQPNAEVNGELVTKLHMWHSADIVPPGDPFGLLDRSLLTRPTLLLDATHNEQIGRRFFPNMAAPVVIDVDAPHQRITQITDKSNSKLRLAIDLDPKWAKRVKPEDLRAAQRHRQELGQLIEVAAAQGEGIGFIANKAVVDDLRPRLPASVATGHFNALRGLDHMNAVAQLILAGRTLPNVEEIEDQAAALFFRDKEPSKTIPPDERGQGGWMWRPRAIVGRDGSVLRFVNAPHHPDERCMAVLEQVCTAELAQAVARARGVRRTATNPVDILMLTNWPGPWPVDRLTTLDELIPEPWAVMRGRGIVPLSPEGMAAIHPDLFGWLPGGDPISPEAVKKMVRRMVGEKLGTFSIKEYLYGECPEFHRAAYRLAGGATRGPVPEVAFDPARFTEPEVRRRLEAAHARAVTRFEVQNKPATAWSAQRKCGIIILQKGGDMSDRKPTLAEAKSIQRNMRKISRDHPGLYDEVVGEAARAALAENPWLQRAAEAFERKERIEALEYELRRRDDSTLPALETMSPSELRRHGRLISNRAFARLARDHGRLLMAA